MSIVTITCHRGEEEDKMVGKAMAEVLKTLKIIGALKTLKII